MGCFFLHRTMAEWAVGAVQLIYTVLPPALSALLMNGLRFQLIKFLVNGLFELRRTLPT